MSRKLPKPPILHRDGTSQTGRLQAALSPDYVSVDERTIKDLLTFAREYASELKYFNSQNKEFGDWSAFISPDVNLDDVISFMEDPNNVTQEKIRRFSRPHFALFLTFLKLLGNAQQHLNTLTRRHLEFYYENVLRMSKKAAIADQVNLLAKPARDVDQFHLPAGTLLSAGPDSQGKDRLYSTERDIVVNHSQIAKLSSLYVDKEIIGIRQAREGHKGTKEEAVIQMLMIAFGDPRPGDPLPDYKEQKIDYPFLLSLTKLVNFTQTDLFLPFFEFRTMMELKGQRDGADAQWNTINELLEKVGKKRTGNPAFRLDTDEPRNFDANLVKAVGKKPDFDGLPQVENITDLYDQRNRQDVREFIKKELYFENIKDFFDMMQIKVVIDNEWKEINRIIEQAGQRKDRSYRLIPEDLKDFDPANFNDHLKDAVNPDFLKLPDIANIDQYYVALMDIEKYFFMTLENFSYLMTVAIKTDSTFREWDKVYKILADAYKVKFYTHRRQRLRDVRVSEGFDAMLHLALGEDSSQAESSPLKRLKEEELKVNDNDYSFLETISKRIDANKVVEDKEWDRVYRIVELAQRIQERLPEPVPLKEEWHNFYAYEDATSVVVTDSTKNDKDNSRWKTFGQQRPQAREDNLPPSIVGWAISTPLLGLSQGNRTIQLTLGFHSDSFVSDKINPLLPDGLISASANNAPFLFEISTAKGWIEPNSVKVKKGDYQSLSEISGLDGNKEKLPALQFTLTFAQDVDALAPLPEKEAQFNTPWPVLRLMMRQIWKEDRQQFIIHYPALKELELVCTHVKVHVSGLIPSHIQNDETVLDANKPFEPFGSSPAVGSRFFLGHPELVYKTFDNLTFHIEWMGVPDNLKTHYKNYDKTWPTDNDNFFTGISLIDRRLVLSLKSTALLFSNITNVNTEHSIAISRIPETLEAKQPSYKYKRILETLEEDDLLLWSRYLQWDLKSPDFQHKTYPSLAAQKSIEMAATIANKQNVVAANYQVNPPYTPTIKRLTLEYTSSVEINLDEYKYGVQSDQIYHIHPFGYNEVQPEAATKGYSFLPQYNNEGELYIGIKDVTPRQNLSILFQMAEGSANPDLESVPIQWTYLNDNRWISLHEGNILFDTTRGLINSGIIEFKLEPVKPNTRLPGDFYWLRAAITRNSNSVCDAVAIETQAFSATFVDNDNAPDHYSRPLAVNSISNLAEPQPEITSVQQPYTSFGGKMQEQDTLFYTRVSERLRHKQRALTLWDYEHLILERFPQVYKAKCLPSDVREHPDESGKVEIIIIPDIRNQQPFDPFEPKASANLITDIESYLLDKSPAYSSVRVRNAHYIAVKVRVGVRFKQGVDEGYFKELLNKELNRFLSPWAYEEGADIVIGGKIYANSIIDFIDQRNYVDYVAGIKLFSSDDGQSFKLVQPSDSQGYFVATDKPDSVLVAARRHEIDIIYEIDYEEKIFTGINYMKLELDFIVASD